MRILETLCIFAPEILLDMERVFRTLYNKTYYRLFAFWDREANTLVVATHGIVKKTQKTPVREISKAEKLRILYFENKNND